MKKWHILVNGRVFSVTYFPPHLSRREVLETLLAEAWGPTTTVVEDQP